VDALFPRLEQPTSLFTLYLIGQLDWCVGVFLETKLKLSILISGFVKLCEFKLKAFLGVACTIKLFTVVINSVLK
jgi:hypothetical protein